VLKSEVKLDPKDGLLTDELKPGMVLKESLYNDKDILILPEGHKLDEGSISKLRILEKRFDFTLNVMVKA
jgi:hypothetical protein